MTPTRWIVFALIAVVTLGGLVALSKKDDINVDDVNAFSVVKNDKFTDHVYGKADAKVVLIEYADFQCPGCAGVYPEVTKIKEEYKDKIAFVYRAFPLTSIHPNALAAAGAAEAAAKQGKFWEMHDLLFESQDAWESLSPSDRGTAFSNYARQLGLNLDRFNTDISSPEVSYSISYARALGGKSGVSATPTLYIGDKLMSDEIRGDLTAGGKKLRQELDAALKAAGETPPTAEKQQ